MPTIDSTPESMLPSHPLAIKLRRRAALFYRLLGLLILAAVFAAIFSRPLALRFGAIAGAVVLVAGIGGSVALIYLIYCLIHYSLLVGDVNRLARSAEALGRWTCPIEDQQIFIARERERLGIYRQVYVYVLYFAVGFALLYWLSGAIFRGHGWHLRDFAVTLGICLAFAAALEVYLMIYVASELAALPTRFAGEIIIGKDGVLTLNNYSALNGFTKKLVKVQFEAAHPAELVFTVRTTHSGKNGTSTTEDEVRVPVPAGQEAEARKVVAALDGK